MCPRDIADCGAKMMAASNDLSHFVYRYELEWKDRVYLDADFSSHGDTLTVTCDFVNDTDYAKAYVDFVANKKGGRLIRMELKQKGLTDEDIDGALQDVSTETQEDAAMNVLQKYLRSKELTKETLQKAFRYLMGKGFDCDVAKTVLRKFGETDDD